MSGKTHCFEILLDGKITDKVSSVVVAHGDDAFLRRETVKRILDKWQISADELRQFDGENCAWIDVHDELATLSAFAGGPSDVGSGISGLIEETSSGVRRNS